MPRPDPRFDDIDLLESRANSNYNALQARFQQRLTRGFSALASYTWSKSIDDASNFFSSAGDPNFPQNSFNVAAERGRSNFDVRHRLSVSYSYAFPFGKDGCDGLIATLVERLGNVRHRDASIRPTVHRGTAFRDRQQRHGPIDSRLRRQRSAQPRRKSGAFESDDVAMVQHRRVRVPGSGNVWKCGQEYSGGSGISEREYVAVEEHAISRARESCSSAPRPSTSSTIRTSTCRTTSSARRRSAGSRQHVIRGTFSLG